MKNRPVLPIYAGGARPGRAAHCRHATDDAAGGLMPARHAFAVLVSEMVLDTGASGFGTAPDAAASTAGGVGGSGAATVPPHGGGGDGSASVCAHASPATARAPGACAEGAADPVRPMPLGHADVPHMYLPSEAMRELLRQCLLGAGPSPPADSHVAVDKGARMHAAHA